MFGGIGTVPKTAIEMKRYGIGIELNNSYFRDMVGYCEQADNEQETFTLFDLIDELRKETL
jgi:hypothetical protein